MDDFEKCFGDYFESNYSYTKIVKEVKQDLETKEENEKSGSKEGNEFLRELASIILAGYATQNPSKTKEDYRLAAKQAIPLLPSMDKRVGRSPLNKYGKGELTRCLMANKGCNDKEDFEWIAARLGWSVEDVIRTAKKRRRRVMCCEDLCLRRIEEAGERCEDCIAKLGPLLDGTNETWSLFEKEH